MHTNPSLCIFFWIYKIRYEMEEVQSILIYIFMQWRNYGAVTGSNHRDPQIPGSIID